MSNVPEGTGCLGADGSVRSYPAMSKMFVKASAVAADEKIIRSSVGSIEPVKAYQGASVENPRRGIMQENSSAPRSVSSSLQLPAQVDDLMTQAVMSLQQSATFGDAVSLLASQHFRHSVIVDEQGKIKGVISDRDLLRALARTPDWKTKPITDIMTHDPFVVHPCTSVAEALAQLIEKRINCLPVVDDDGKVCGILTSTDFLKSYHRILGAWRFHER
jgi:CBS domain-containing protein